MRSLPFAQASLSFVSCCGGGLVLLVLLACGGRLTAQNVAPDDPPAVVAPPKLTQKQKDHRESLYKYLEGVECEKKENLLEALQAFREAARLDPEAAPVYKAQVRVLLTLNSVAAALDANAKVIELTPADLEARYIQARLFKMLGKIAESRDALRKGLAIDAAKDHPELAHQMAFDLATLLEGEHAYKDAAEAYSQAVSILEHPKHSLELGLRSELIQARIAEVYERMGTMYSKDSQFDKAIAAYRKAQEKSPDNARKLSLNLAQVCVALGKNTEALAAVEDYLRQQPQGTEAYQLKIKLLLGLGRGEQVLPWLEKASADDAFNSGLRLLLADQYVQAKRLDQAEKIYLDMHVKAPDADVYRGLFGICRQEGAPGLDKLLKMLNKVFEEATAGDGPNVAQVQGRAILTVLREDAALGKLLVRQGLEGLETRKDLNWRLVDFLAVLADRHGQLADAERLYASCLKNLEKDAANAAIVEQALVRILFKARKFDAVERVCKERLTRTEGQERLSLLEDLARALAREDRFNEALAAIDEAIKTAPNGKMKMELQFTRSNILGHKGDYKQAETECRALLAATNLPSEMVVIHLQLSNIFSAAHQNDKSEEELQWVLRFQPDHTGANNDLGYLWADQNKNLKEAEAMIRRALETSRQERKSGASITQEEDMDYAAYVDSLGWVLFRQGKLAGARKELERASSQPDGDDYVIWDHLGDVYLQLQMVPEAKAAWQRSLQLFERDHVRNQEERLRELQRKVKTATPAQ